MKSQSTETPNTTTVEQYLKRICPNQPENEVIFANYTAQEIPESPFSKINWEEYTDQIASIAESEDWSNETYPNNGILVNYMKHTYEKLHDEGKIIVTKEYSIFNTGLFTETYEPIYAYAAPDESISFLTPYELCNLGIDNYPEQANYYEDPSLLLFDWHYKINVRPEHIIDDIKNFMNTRDFNITLNMSTIVNGSIEIMKKRVYADPKLAIPQYYNGSIQLLLPLCLETDYKPNFALVVSKIGNVYQAHTCLTLDVAYSNARLIEKQGYNWLLSR